MTAATDPVVRKTLAATAAAALLLAAGLWAPVQPARAQAAAPAAAASGPTVRPAFGALLQAAQAALAGGRAPEALAKLDEAAALPALTPYETMILERTRAAVAEKQGNMALTIKSLEAALATGQVAVDEELGLTEVMVSLSAGEKDHARVLKWSQRYIDLKGPNDAVRLMRIQSQVASGDERGAAAALVERVEAADKAGRPLPEPQQRLLLGLQQQAKDPAAVKTMERLALQYPRPEYWSNVIVDAARRAGDNERATIELFRLLRATGALTSAPLREGLAQNALRTGEAAEALVVVEEGFAAGVLGSGADAAAHQKLREQARKAAAADVADRPAAEAAARRAGDGNALVQLGWSMVAALPAGTTGGAAAEQGLALIEQGIAKGSLRRPAEAQLHLGIAQLAAGRKDPARQTLGALAKTAVAPEPLVEPIRLWALWAAAPPMLPKAS